MNNNSLIKNIGTTIEILPEVDSTNNYAMRMVHDGTAEHGHSIIGLCQTNGKGQRGKLWYTGKDTNLALSIILSTSFLPLDKAFYLHCYVCCSIGNYIKGLMSDINIKWPNDIFYKNKKLGGILIENTVKGRQLNYSVIGIGININDDTVHQMLPNAVSIGHVLGQKLDILNFATSLLQEFDTNWALFKQNPSIFYEQYVTLLWKKNNVITIKHKGEIITTICKSANEQGQLICGENNELVYNFGEIEWLY